MAIRQITIDGDEILRKHCKPVRIISDRIRTLCQDMIDTMISADGVGLAAPQVGVMKRIFVCRPDLENMENYYIMINPEITYTEGSQPSTEGCLSVPGYVGTVERPELVRLHAQNLDGEDVEYEFSGFGATVICHEYDHLDGTLYTDKAHDIMTSEEYDRMLQETREQEEAAEEA
ncbi:MAG: peptide deformylase [Mogibacterium sp.]|nr:peptide deformylase [Mogibacterium sp.]